MKAKQEAVLHSASVISSEGGVVAKPRIELPSGSSETERPKAAPAYGIEQAIKLLESLPQGGRNRDLVYQVVKTTLQSLNVEISQIVADAGRKEQQLEVRLKGLDDEIVEFEARIKGKRREALGLRKQHQQVQLVRQQLEQSDRRSGKLPKQKAAAKSSPVVGATSPASPTKVGGVFSALIQSLVAVVAGLFAALGKLGSSKPKPAAPQKDTSLPLTPRAEVAAPAAASPSQPAESDLPAPTPQALAA